MSDFSQESHGFGEFGRGGGGERGTESNCSGGPGPCFRATPDSNYPRRHTSARIGMSQTDLTP